jgi:hypothetical protein
VKTSERVYRWLLRVFPGAFRAHYEEEMVRLFLDQLRDARGSGRTRDRAGLWLRSVGDVLSSAPAEHLHREEKTVAKPVDPGSVALTAASERSGPTRLGYALACLPFIVLVIAPPIAPGYMEPIFANPPEIVGLPAGMVALFLIAAWASLAFVAIRASRSGVGIAVGLVVFTVPAIVAIALLPSVILVILNLNV